MAGGAPTSRAHQHAGRSAAGIVVPRIANAAGVTMDLTIAHFLFTCTIPMDPFASSSAPAPFGLVASSRAIDEPQTGSVLSVNCP